MFRRGALLTVTLMVMMIVHPLTSSARHVIDKINTQGVPDNHGGEEEAASGRSLGRQRRQQRDDADDDRVATSDGPQRTTTDVAGCRGDVGQSCRRRSTLPGCRRSRCRRQRRDTLPGDLLSFIKAVKDARQVGDSPVFVAAGEASTTSAEQRATRRTTSGDVVGAAHLRRRLTDRSDCRRRQRLTPAGGDVIDDVIGDVTVARAAAADKRFPSGGGGAASLLMDLCSSQLATGGRRQSACFNHYLQNFARHITTSGNKFVGR